MKKIFSLVAAVCLMASCSDSFLDSENLTKKDTGNFPQTVEDAEQLLTGAYRPLLGDVNVHDHCSPFLIAELMSDERLGAGGTDDNNVKAVAAFKKNDENMYARCWQVHYEGIFRANSVIAFETNVAWPSDDVRNRILGEAYFLRAYYYFELGRMFGHVPVVLTPDPVNNPQAEPAELYGQIAADFVQAIKLMPSTPWTPGMGTDGHATKWAAEAMLARAFLFYTGYYNASEIALPEEVGGTLTKQDVIGYIDDCVSNSGHKLISDFRNLWPYTAAKDYKFNTDNKLEWIGEDGQNTEALFVIKHSGNDWVARNSDAMFFGLRYQSDGAGDWMQCYPFGQGWGCGTVTPNIYETWPSNDPRRKGSILNVDDPDEGLVHYYDGMQNQVQDTHLWNKKYTPISTKTDDPSVSTYIGQGAAPLYWALNPAFLESGNPDYQSNNLQDTYIVRFSDVLLMQSELKQDADGINKVRARVGLDPVAYTEENLQNERRWELAFEGIRYYDLLRWHKEQLITDHRSDVPVLNQAQDAKVSVPFRAETKGFLPIPDQEIQKSEGVLVQNEGWASNEGNW